ncbi:MAG: DUF2157 domain-containing protein [Akkermansia sp.]|nr:DUF2157 domain-containing protein [Akkermansia sp.]
MKSKDVDNMLAAGLISPEQGMAIRKHFCLDENRWSRWLLYCLIALAGVFIVAGLVMLVSANWDEIGPLGKMLVAMELLVFFWVLWYLKRKTSPLLAEMWGLCGAGMWLGCIALYGQIFQLQNPFVEGCTLFFSGIVLLPFVSKQRFIIWLVMVVSFVLLVVMGVEDDSILSFANWIKGWKPQYIIYTLPLLLALWWGLSEKWRVCSERWRSYGWMAPLLLVVAVIVGQCMMYLDGEDITLGVVEWVLMGLVPVLLLLLKPRSISWLSWCSMSLLISLLLPSCLLSCYLGELAEDAVAVGDLGEDAVLVGLCGISDWMSHAVGIAIYFGMASVMMSCGVRSGRVSWVNIGSLMVVFAAVALVADVLGSYTFSGLVLVVGGLLMLLVVVLLEKKRRKLVKSVKNEAISSQS